MKQLSNQETLIGQHNQKPPWFLEPPTQPVQRKSNFFFMPSLIESEESDADSDEWEAPVLPPQAVQTQ